MPSPYRPKSPRPKNNAGQNRGNFRKEDKGPKRNDRIRATEVRVISPKGEMVGVMPTQQALDLAREFGVDLIEINVDQSDVDAQRFYERHGFDGNDPDTGERAFYYSRELADG